MADLYLGRSLLYGPTKTVELDERPTVRTRRARRGIYARQITSAQQPQPIVLDVRDVLWKLDGACTETDPELFFTDNDSDLEQLRAICADCPVLAKCRDYADEHRLAGFWAGTTEDERRRQRKRRSDAARKARSTS